MWVQREIREELERLAGQRPIVVLSGARQTGKTSLVRRLFPGHQYVSLDLPAHAALAEREPAAFLKQFPPPLVVDEVQYAPELFRFLKADVDAHRDQSGRFILTGSQPFRLMEHVSDSLAGRAALLQLHPLSFRELLNHDGGARVDDFLLRGGYPELHQKETLRSFEYYSSYVATYLERDVRSLLRVGSLRDFDRFLRACALRSAQLLNKSELARDVGISPSTAGEWLSVLEASGQVVLLEPWFQNRTRSMAKSPKLYLTDPGLMAFLLAIQSWEDLQRSPYRGALWETFCLTELLKRMALSHPGVPLYFYRDRNREVDFLIHKGGEFTLLEAKWTEQPRTKDLASMDWVAERLGNVSKRAVLCRSDTACPFAEGCWAFGAKDAWFDL